MALFDRAIEMVLRHEGGYVNDPADRGGETKYGITKASYPELDIKGLSRDEASDIYHRDFWVGHGYCDIESDGLAAKVLDIAVNVGPTRANKWLQEAVNELGVDVAVDGVFGPASRVAVNRLDPVLLTVRFLMRAFRHYRKLGYVQPKFARGWMKRLWGI